MIKPRLDKQAMLDRIKGLLPAIRPLMADIHFYTLYGLSRHQYETIIQRITTVTSITEKEIQDFVQSNKLSYEDLDWFIVTAGYLRFPNKVEANLLYLKMYTMLQYADHKQTTADKLWPHRIDLINKSK